MSDKYADFKAEHIEGPDALGADALGAGAVACGCIDGTLAGTDEMRAVAKVWMLSGGGLLTDWIDNGERMDPRANEALRAMRGKLSVAYRPAAAPLPLDRAVAARALELMDEVASIRESMADTDPETLRREDDADVAELALEACDMLHGPLAEALSRAEGIEPAVEAKRRARAVALLDALADESRNWSDTGMVFVEEARDLGSLGDGFNEEDLRCLEEFLGSPEGACYAGAVEAESSPVPGDPVITCYGALPDVHEAAKEAADGAFEAKREAVPDLARDTEQLAQYQAEMVDIARSLGLDPRTDISEPAYYGDMIGEAIGNLKAQAAGAPEAAFGARRSDAPTLEGDLAAAGHAQDRQEGRRAPRQAR